jgi:hypothetical protein
MPYIKKDQRYQLAADLDKLVSTMNNMGDDARKGVLNYVITKIALGVIGKEMKYGKVNDVVGAMECCKLELYRRLAAPYEEKKAIENGDVY